MINVVYIVHILACLGLILIVLLQTGKGADMGAAFGGSSQTVFGSTGAATFLSKLTTIVAVVFMITSLGLAIIAGKGAPPSVMQEMPAAEQPAAEQPAAPAEQKPVMPDNPAGQSAAPAASAPQEAPAAAPPAPAAEPAQPAGQGQQ
jgi:preprotein translocase subunit SecG